MNFEKIEQAYTYLLENTQSIQNELSTNFYDALIEQNAMYLDGKTDLDIVKNNSKKLKELGLSKEEWRRAYQFLFMKAAQTEPLQANHQFTPDAIGFIITFLIDQLAKSDQLDVLEVGSGTGNLAETIVNNSRLKIDYLGLEVDDLLIDLSASIADVMGSSVVFAQGDAVRPQVLKESDLIISDLPIGYYPDDAIAQRYQVASSEGHTYAHHLMMEQALKYLKPQGVAIFLAPNNLLTSPQSDLLKDLVERQGSDPCHADLARISLFKSSLCEDDFCLTKTRRRVCSALCLSFYRSPGSRPGGSLHGKFPKLVKG